jgi:flagellar L-ring protein FlgH
MNSVNPLNPLTPMNPKTLVIISQVILTVSLLGALATGAATWAQAAAGPGDAGIEAERTMPAQPPVPQAIPANASPSSSLMSRVVAAEAATAGTDEAMGRGASVSLFAVQSAEARQFNKHDLVQIIVREASKMQRNQKTKAEKEWDLGASVKAWPGGTLADLLNFQIPGGSGDNLPEVDVASDKNFEGKGEYNRQDNMTDRLTAEVLDILPNGNLILEARTSIQTDQEISTMKVTGICRPDDITPANTVLSQQIFDLQIMRMHEGELKRTSEKGIIARVLDTVFAF